MERKLKRFNVTFCFGNSEIHTQIDAESKEEAISRIKETFSSPWQLADFNSIIINLRLLQSIEVWEISKINEEQDDTI